MAVYKINGAGAGAIHVTSAVPAGRTYQLVSVSLHLSAAPTTGANFTITLDADAGLEYDTVLYKLDLSTGSTTDLFWQPDQPAYLSGGDVVDVAYSNPDIRTYGVQITVREA
jgi:hypothetical protein